MTIMIPVISCYMLYTYHHKLEDEDVKKKYGAMYDEYRLEKWYKLPISYNWLL